MKSADFFFFCTDFEGKSASLFDDFNVVKCVMELRLINKFTFSHLAKAFIQSGSKMVAENIIK